MSLLHVEREMAGMATTLLCARCCESSRGQRVSRVTQSEWRHFKSTVGFEWWVFSSFSTCFWLQQCRRYRKELPFTVLRGCNSLLFDKWQAEPLEIRISRHLAQVLVPPQEWRGARACGCSTANCCWKFVGKWPLYTDTDALHLTKQTEPRARIFSSSQLDQCVVVLWMDVSCQRTHIAFQQCPCRLLEKSGELKVECVARR